MASIEVQAPQENEEHITVHDETFDYAKAAERYYQEAQDPALSPMEAMAKIDTADFLASRAAAIASQSLEAKVQEYLGNKPVAHALGVNAVHRS